MRAYRVFNQLPIYLFHRSKINVNNQISICKYSTKKSTDISYYHCLGTQPLVYQTYGELIENAADRYGDREALVCYHQNQRLTYEQAKHKADNLAGGLVKLGLRTGDRIGIWGPNSTEWYLTKLAAARAGLISVDINPAYQAIELKHCINKVGVKVLVAPAQFRTSRYDILLEIAPELKTCQPGELKAIDVPSLESVVFMSNDDFSGVFKLEDIYKLSTTDLRIQAMEQMNAVEADHTCNIQFTSGTTGSPKGASLTHNNIINNSYLIGKRQEYNLKPHRMCLLGPFFHAMGSVIGLLAAMHHGATVIVPDQVFNPEKAIKSIIEEKVTILLGTPTMYIDLIQMMKTKEIKPDTIELAVVGGAPCSPQLFNNMLNTFGLKRVCSVYGLTEAGPVTFMSKPTDSPDLLTSTVGCVMEQVEAKIVDSEGKTVPWGTPGELYVRGFCNMLGYWNDEEKSKACLTQDGWLRSGDQFILDSKGYGRIVGRIKDMIIRGGENIFPAEVEEFLYTHPNIVEVQVVGVPDERLGEEVCACIKLKPEIKLTAEEIKQFCKGKIAYFKIPNHIFFFDELPKTPSGKIQAFKLREKVKELLGR